MTAPAEEPHTTPVAISDAPLPIGKRSAASAVGDVCPYLRSASGGWRSTHASPEHRCGAVDPAALVAVGKQRSLCLVPAHVTCATFVVAGGVSAELGTTGSADGDAALWPATRSTPLVLEPAHGLLKPLASGPARTGGQALLAGLMVLAFLVLVVSRTAAPQTPGAPSPDASSAGVAAAVSPSANATQVPSPSQTPAVSPSPVPTPSPTTAAPSPTTPPAASPPVSPAPTPDASVVRYTVRSGDTLSSIAARFGVTVKAIRLANNIADPRLIHPGQVLIIP